MDSASANPTAEEIANLVVQRFLAGGKLPDLVNVNLMTIEEQTIEQVDQVPCLVIIELFAKQAQRATAPVACPRCGGSMK